jgi:parvulin-like peptidyl-prolyl isomerase
VNIQRTTLAVLSALVIFASSRAAAQEKVAAVVNGEKIPLAEVEKLLRQDTPPVHPLTDLQKREMRKMALDMLIGDALMRQFLAKNAPAVPPAAVARELADVQDALKKKSSSMEQFLKENRMTEQQLREDIVVRLRWKAYVTAKLPDSLLRPYYEANKLFFDKIFVKASHILLKFPEKASVQDKKVLLGKLLAIRKDIVNRKIDFAEAARKYSDCPSKDKGGDIGHFPYKFVVAEPFARAAFALNVGEISEAVETEFGYHIIKVTERTKGEPTTFEKIKEIVRDVYAQEVQLYQNIINEQRKKAQIKVTGL